MTPIHFGSSERRLFGLLQPGQPSPDAGAARTGVVLCNPFGQEAVRVHRMYRVLAERLNRAGLHVLRFDWSGTGDSAGDDATADLERWGDDLVAAHRELKARLLCERLVWVGARLGASVAAQACAQVQGLRRLLLWEPVLDGVAYLRALVADHADALRDNYSVLPPPWNERLRRGDTQVHGELLGFAVSDVLHEQIATLAPTDWPAGPDTVVIGRPGDTALQAFVQSRQAQAPALAPCKLVTLEHSFDWTSEEALNTALVPAGAVHLLADLASAPA